MVQDLGDAAATVFILFLFSLSVVQIRQQESGPSSCRLENERSLPMRGLGRGSGFFFGAERIPDGSHL
jgi:hypothetical protein